MSKLRILLDMDGVIADFVSAALQLHGRSDAIDDWPAGEWDMAKVLGLSRSAFWRAIDEQGHRHWAELEPYPWLDELLTQIRRHGPMTILSSPGMGAEAPTGKILWLRKHVEPDFVNYLFGHQKFLCARSDAILIDDRDKNVEQFRAAGGQAILFPQIWNCNHALVDKRLEYVFSRLNDLAAEFAERSPE